MRLFFFLCLAGGTFLAVAQESQPLEARTSPFDFDSLRRTPVRVRQTSSDWASKNNQEIQRDLISGRRSREQDIAARAATDFPDLQEIPIRRESGILSTPDESTKKNFKEKAAQADGDPASFSIGDQGSSREQEIATRASALFPDPQEIPIRQEPASLPSPNELTDEITTANYGETTKGQRDLLARARVADRLDLSSMSEGDYELYVANYRAEQEQIPAPSGEGLLRPMPTLINSKTDGPPHAYSVSQAGVGARTKPRDGQNPFEDVIRALRLDKPVTKGTDPLPTPSARSAVASAAAPAPVTPAGTEGDTPQDAPDALETKP